MSSKLIHGNIFHNNKLVQSFFGKDFFFATKKNQLYKYIYSVLKQQILFNKVKNQTCYKTQILKISYVKELQIKNCNKTLNLWLQLIYWLGPLGRIMSTRLCFFGFFVCVYRCHCKTSSFGDLKKYCQRHIVNFCIRWYNFLVFFFDDPFLCFFSFFSSKIKNSNGIPPPCLPYLLIFSTTPIILSYFW